LGERGSGQRQKQLDRNTLSRQRELRRQQDRVVLPVSSIPRPGARR
jgi:hypothetical protein